ncbi:PilZ domain-containing protein [Spirochaetia bacterium 38H-sp]|uniref:PilZ domain-containing protein n=1 Tax=Rarispira pelagica TaxID=3141764 RepID=A0ABU9UCV4_9SPIR
MLIFLIVLGISLILFLIFFLKMGGFAFPWVKFYIEGKESGFSLGELNLLRKLALENKLKNPTSLFWSEKALNTCIGNTILKQRKKGIEHHPHSIEYLGKLFEFRKRVEFSLPKYRLGIKSSREIDSGQILRIIIPEYRGTIFTSTVIENMRKYMAITHPQAPNKELSDLNWTGKVIHVYFWRKEDAGYFFESRVLGDYMEKKFAVLHIEHSDDLKRTQKRKSVRLPLNITAMLYPIQNVSSATEDVEKTGGFKCKLIDVSEDGAAVVVGGRAKPGIAVKLQFVLGDDIIVMPGVVKGVSFKKANNRSVLHIQSVPLSQKTKNKILSRVYGIFGPESGVAPPDKKT